MTDQEIRLKFGEMNAGEMRLARALVAWHEREIAKLKEELAHAERWRDKLDTKLTEVVEAAERAGWGDVENSKNLPTFITYLAEDLSKAQAELAALRQPILADDGRSLGQVAMNAAFDADTEGLTVDECYEAAAKAVVAAARPAIEAECLAQAVWRMEDVPVEGIARPYEAAAQFHASGCGLEAVRARLVAAAKGEGQPVVVNKPPKSEEQPDLCGESEKQDEPATKEAPATFQAHGKVWTRHTPGDPMPCDGDAEIDYMMRDHGTCSDLARTLRWAAAKEHESRDADIIGWRYADEPAQAHQEPAQPWTPDNAKAYEDFQAELRETWAAQPWTPAVGDTVRLKSGGPAMTVTDIDPLSLMCAWMNADNELQVEPITTLCLEPAQP